MKYADSRVLPDSRLSWKQMVSASCVRCTCREQGRVGAHGPDFQTPMVPVVPVDSAGHQKRELLLPL